MRIALRSTLLLWLLGILVLILAPAASAHAVVVSSNPADGARLAKAPAAVSLTFDEQVGLDVGYLRVIDSAGRRVDTGTASHPQGNGSVVSVPLTTGLGDGSYLASYRVTSADSHPVAGSIRFVVGNGALELGATGSGSTPVDSTVSKLLASSHWLSFAGVGLVGGSWLIFSLWPDGQRRAPVRRLVWTGWALAGAGAIAEFVLQGPYAAGSGLSTVGRTELLDASLHVNAGHLLSLRLVLLGLVGVLLTALFSGEARRQPSWAPAATAVVGAGIVITFAASGHSQSMNPRWLFVLIDAVHLSAMIIWLGGLMVLLVAAFSRPGNSRPAADLQPVLAGVSGLPERPTERPAGDAELAGDELAGDELAGVAHLSAGLPIFSRIAMACVATLAVTGTIQAWREIGAVDAITSTRYGQLVLFKVVLFGALLGLGYFARKAVLSRGAGRSLLARLRKTLLTEVLIGAVVLGATAVLISQPPGKVALAAQRNKPRSTTVSVTATSQAVVEIDPAVHGSVRIGIQLGAGLKPINFSATASLPARQLGPIPLVLQAAGGGSYTANVLLPAAGNWEISLAVQTSEFDSTVAVATVKVS